MQSCRFCYRIISGRLHRPESAGAEEQAISRAIHYVRLRCRRVDRGAMLALAVAASQLCAAQGVPPEVRQQLRDRASYQHELALKQRQSQQAAQPGLRPSERAELERLHAAERRGYDMLEQEATRRQVENAAITKELPEADAKVGEAVRDRRAAERREQARWRLEQDSRQFLDAAGGRDEREAVAPDGD